MGKCKNSKKCSYINILFCSIQEIRDESYGTHLIPACSMVVFQMRQRMATLNSGKMRPNLDCRLAGLFLTWCMLPSAFMQSLDPHLPPDSVMFIESVCNLGP